MIDYKYKFSIIIPAYNEKNRIVKTIKNIYSYFLGKKFEIIIVNDGSTDKTADHIKKENIGPEIKIINYQPNRGKGYAIKRGVAIAQGELILFTDADNSTPIEELDKLITAIRQDFDIAIGSRYLLDSRIKIKQNFFRILTSRLGNFLIKLILIKNIQDTQCGFKLFKNPIAKKLFKKQTIFGWSFDLEILALAQYYKFKIKEIPICWYNDENSKLNLFPDTIIFLRDLIKIKLNLLTHKYKK